MLPSYTSSVFHPRPFHFTPTGAGGDLSTSAVLLFRGNRSLATSNLRAMTLTDEEKHQVYWLLGPFVRFLLNDAMCCGPTHEGIGRWWLLGRTPTRHLVISGKLELPKTVFLVRLLMTHFAKFLTYYLLYKDDKLILRGMVLILAVGTTLKSAQILYVHNLANDNNAMEDRQAVLYTGFIPLWRSLPLQVLPVVDFLSSLVPFDEKGYRKEAGN